MAAAASNPAPPKCLTQSPGQYFSDFMSSSNCGDDEQTFQESLAFLFAEN